MKSQRWFRYTLRTLFVLLTLLGIALGWLAVHVKWKHDRSEARKSIRAFSATRLRELGFDIAHEPDAPLGLRLLGEDAVKWIFPSRQSKYSAEQLKQLFPEAGQWKPDGTGPDADSDA